MRDYSKIIELSKKNNGYVFSSDIVSYGIAKDYLKFAIQDEIIEKVEQGIYIIKGNFIDNLFIIQKANSRIIYSAYTSAYLQELTTRDSGKIYATVPLSYHSTKLTKDNYIVRENKDIYDLGQTTIISSFGNEIVCHDIHRTVCDLFSSKYVGDKFVQNEALKTYLMRKDKDLIRLKKYAKILNVEEELRNKLEVLV